MIELGISLTNELCLIDAKKRYEHMFVIGSTGSGKSTFLLNLINWERDNAVIVLDPHGEMAEQAAALVDKKRLTYISRYNPISLNPLTRKYLSKTEKVRELINVVNSSVKAVTPDQVAITVKMTRILNEAIAVMTKDEEIDIKYISEFLDLEARRDEHFRKHVKPDFWNEFDKGGTDHARTRETASRITDRMALLYWDEVLAKFFLGDNQFNVKRIAEEKLVYIFDLSGFDKEVTAFIGNLVTHQIQSYGQHQADRQSPSLYVYIDEWSLFITDLMDKMLSQVRHYNVSFNLVGQSLEQVDRRLRELVLSCTYSKVVFRCGYADAELVGREFDVTAKQIKSLKDYEAWIGLGGKGYKVLSFPPVDIEPYDPRPKDKELADRYDFLRNAWMMYN
jgi:type IV secretory pathway TraG/TraD family ATPase VirD4